MNQLGHLLEEMQIDGLDFDVHAVLADGQFVSRTYWQMNVVSTIDMFVNHDSMQQAVRSPNLIAHKRVSLSR